MFKRITAMFFLALLLAGMALAAAWWKEPVLELYSVKPVERIFRLSQDLSGTWNRYGSVTQAWKEEKAFEEGGQDPSFFRGLFTTEQVVLPSTAQEKVVARQFQVSKKWGARTGQLIFEGVTGKLRVYLNGIGSEHLLGEVEAYGGSARFTVEVARLNFENPNILIAELSKSDLQKRRILGKIWPEPLRITGKIRLDAVGETVFSLEDTTYAFDKENKQWTVRTYLNHYQFLENGPWEVSGALRMLDGTLVSQCSLPISSEDEYYQKVELLFPLSDPLVWSLETPQLYQLELRVTNSRGDYDTLHTRVGIAEVGQRGGQWLLNEQALFVSGLVLSAEKEQEIRQAKGLDAWLIGKKKEGINAIYFNQFFPDENWFFAADRVGIGIWTSLPASMPRPGDLPDPSSFTTMMRMAERHPSHMAWTVGTELPEGQELEGYLAALCEQTEKLLFVNYFQKAEVWQEGVKTLYLRGPLEGDWGSIAFADEGDQDQKFSLTSRKSQIAAGAWLLLILYTAFQNVRCKNWSYKDLFQRPRRALRESFFWRGTGFLVRMGTLGAIWLSVYKLIPFEQLALFPYDLSWFAELQRQSFLLIWLFISLFFVMLKLMQIGIGTNSFPNRPEAMGLLCVLERRNSLIFLAGVALLLMTFGFPSFLALIVYYGILLLTWPWRIYDVRKAGGRNLPLLFLPCSVLLTAGIGLLSQWRSFGSLGGLAFFVVEKVTGFIF